MSSGWEHSEDFGQKVDLTVRIREILRNYPEGLSILKELIQNADDAGARTIKFCTAEPRPIQSNVQSTDNLSNVMKGPSLFAFNSAKFTETDFKSIQRIGDSLKKDKSGTKTGRFGVGVNSCYHLTDVPMFASGSKIVMFDPMANHVPNINPANPGKMIDCANQQGRSLVQSLPHVFDPMKVFGCDLSGKDFNGTLFRFALRTEEQARVSRLSRQAHPLNETRDLLQQMGSAAPKMLLFLKNVECIEIYDWKANDSLPTMISRTALGNASDKLRLRRSYVLNAPSRVPTQPQAVDYLLDIETTSTDKSISDGTQIHVDGWNGTMSTAGKKTERWIVCNQLGGGNASKMANDPALSHMKLVPWAGVAARLSPACKPDEGNAYCFLPLPVHTKLPVHVNGYFELSSNRRDVWWGEDMAGDGRARADWNKSIVRDIAAPCYIRLLTAAIRANQVTKDTYETLFPQKDLVGPWKILGEQFMHGIVDAPVLYSDCVDGSNWIEPKRSLLMHDENNTKLYKMLAMDKLPLVLLASEDLKKMLLRLQVCRNTTSPSILRRYFSNRKELPTGCLEVETRIQNAEYLLDICKSDLSINDYSALSGCQFVPLASGDLGRFTVLPDYGSGGFQQLQSMGFSKLLSAHALRLCKNDADAAMEWLLTNRYNDEAVLVTHGIDPFLVCGEDTASILRRSAPNSFVDLDLIDDPNLKKFFSANAVSRLLNLLPVQNDMLADIVSRAVPCDWRGKDSAPWSPDREYPDVQWFISLWRYICSSADVKTSLTSIAEHFCIVPTNEGVVCSLSPGNSVITTNGLNEKILQSLVRVGVRTLYDNVFPTDLVIPSEIYSYIFDSTRDGVIRAIDAATRRKFSGWDNVTTPQDEMKDCIFQFFVTKDHCPISTPCKVMLRNFPIFRRFLNEYNSSTEFVSMSSSTWFILENASEEEKELMTSDFLCTSNSKEVEFFKLLGAKVMNKSDFFKRVVIPNIAQVPKESMDRIIENVLLNLSSMSAADPDFDTFLSKTKFIRSSSTQTLRSPSELYDPEVPMLLTLMDHDYFPDEFYMQPNLLLGLRKLGLKSTLSWETVLECAKSIEAEASSGDDNAAARAKGRGSELLLFLDINVETFFPELVKKSNTSRSGRFFKKMNQALFSDADKMREEKELQAQRVHNLLNIKWLPVHVEPPQLYLPWPENILSVAAPIETVTSDKMWLTSFSKRLVDGDVHSHHLKKLFGWLDEISVKDVSLQLRMMGKTFELIKDQNRSIENEEERQNHFSSVCQKYSSEVGRMYHILNSVESDYEKDVIKSNLHASAWLWMGDGFISSDHIAYSSSINAQPYLFTVPPDLACFRNLLSTFNIRQTFGSSDYCMVLSRMAKDFQEKKTENSARTIELAVSLVQKISDDVFRLTGFDIYAPTQNGNLEQVGNMVYDDAPWLSKDLPGKKGLIYAHEKLSASVCEKIGMTSVRKLLLHSTTDTISFGDGVVHEAFGQSESLTRRLKNIVEMYPEGTQQLSELIQNADDANANVVKFVVSTRQYGTSSLLGQKMADWQGGALYCYNDATFTARDFKNLSQIGQGSKLEKLVTTGRFGLGFNSVFHWTDVPQIVSGDHLVIFDPHAKYVPNATDMSRGIKIRFADTELRSQFPDQMDSYCYFDCDMKSRFEGTLFRFPFRTAKTAASSEISKKQYSEEGALDELVSGFKKVISKTLLFLRHVKRIEFYVEKNESGPELQFYADVAERVPVQEESTSQYSGMSAIRSLATSAGFGTPQYQDWNSISEFIANDNGMNLGKEAFYGKLMRTPENQLPRTKHIVTINFFSNEHSADEDRNNIIEDKYLICSALGAGQCRAIACNPSNFENKFLPWGNVAAHLSRNGNSLPLRHGNAFCFLPLPAETGFNVHINGYFELSANRRDIWVGSDMTGQGHIRSEWNRSLLWDVISPLYIQLLLTARSLIGPGHEYAKLWPTQVSSDIWKIVRSRVYQIAEDTPLFYTPLKGGQWVSMKLSVFLQEEEFKDDEIKVQRMSLKNKMLLDILLQENLNMVTIPKSVVECMKAEACVVNEANSAFVRDWFKKEVHHPSLNSRENAVFLLRYCLDDIFEEKRWKQVYGLPLLPLANGQLGKITDPNSSKFFVVNKEEKYLMEEGSRFIVDTWTDDSRLNVYLMNKSFQEGTNLQSIDSSNFVRLISYAYPEEWRGLPEIHWQPNKEDNSSTPNNFEWLTRLWDYIGSDQCITVNDMHLFLNSVQIIPSTVGDEDRTLQILFKDMSVVNVEDSPKASETMKIEIGIILRSIGIRTLDCSVFKGKHKSSVFKILKEFVKPSTVRGILTAFVNSFPGDLSNTDIVDRMKARFKYVDDSQKKLLREFMCDAIENDLNPDELAMLKMLPIFPVFSHGNIILSNLKEEALIPPLCADNNHLDESFVHIESSKDKEFMHKIGVPVMSAQSYYSSYAPRVVANTELEKDTRITLVVKMLQDTLRLSEEKDGENFVRSLSTINFVMNAKGNLVSPKDLYDPTETALTYLVDDSMLPAQELRTGSILQSLRLLGMNTRLSINGIIESARQIELQAKNLSIEDAVSEGDVSNLRQRATALLNFLDDDNVVIEFNVDMDDDSSKSDAVVTSDIFEELYDIMWLPVEQPMENSESHLEPPRRIHQLSHVGISSPELTRPKTDEWMCSASMDILSLNIKSEALLEKFHWDAVPNAHIVAKQLVALGQLSQSHSQSLPLRQQISKVSSQMYEILNNLCSVEDLNEDESEIQNLLSILDNSSWIWVGDRFVKTSQVAFEAPENAKPFLYSVPENMTCFEPLLLTCGVRNSFSGSDYVELLYSLSSHLNGGTLDSKQTDLAIFVARNLSRVPREELDVLDFSKIYLPSRDSKMYRANEMTFDDAPWLSAIVKKTRHVFVHPDVGNEAALTLGAKSLRDVLSSKQNGMVQIPCPKLEALQQLLKKRKESNQEYCRTVLDVIEVGEMKGVKQISITVDNRNHQTMSLVHPCLAQAQGPALIICFHDISLEVDEVIRLTSPAKYYSSTTSGGGGGGGSGFPRYGRGLCGTFLMTDCLQVVTGSSFLIFDPSGQYLIEDKTKINNNEEANSVADEKKKTEKAYARNYGLSHAFCQQFPDQFDPFLSLNVGLEESLVNGEHSPSGPYFRGTIIRLPLRTADGPTKTIASSIFCKSNIEKMSSSLEEALPKSVLFSYNLQSISLDIWNPLEDMCERILSSRISSSPLTRREHFDVQMDTKSWRKEKNKLNKLFKSSWSPKRGFIIVQISTRIRGASEDIVDSYAIQSVLGPKRLREMANTDSLCPLNLVPTVSLAAHLHRSGSPLPEISTYATPEETLYVGFDTGIHTGLPFIINAPLFLHEWSGDVLLSPTDDEGFKSSFPGIRNIILKDKYNNTTARSLALYVWNRQAISSAIQELPFLLSSIRQPLELSFTKNPKLLYKFWPYHDRIKDSFRSFCAADLYQSLADDSMNLYLTQNDGFKSIHDGCFTSPTHQLNEAASFFLQHMSMFTVPRLVVENLTKFDLQVKTFSPQMARSLLKGNRYTVDLRRSRKECLAVLQYCLADFIVDDVFDTNLALSKRQELYSLQIVPMADGSLGRIGDQIIIATAQQQAMMPCLRNKFISTDTLKVLAPFIDQTGFAQLLHLEKFGPQILSKHVHKVLPSSWENKEFVQWSEDEGPSKIWLYQFWNEVSISSNDQVQLFRRWPLIPTRTGELASCGNARFLINICPATFDVPLKRTLQNDYKNISEEFVKKVENNQDNVFDTNQHAIPDDTDSAFWEMGAFVAEEYNEGDEHVDLGVDMEVTNDDSSFRTAGSDSVENNVEQEVQETSNIQIDPSGDIEIQAEPDLLPERSMNIIQPQSLSYDPNNSEQKNLLRILIALRAPLLDPSFFNDEDVKKLLSPDKLGVSRNIMSSLNQSINYWSSSQNRLEWNKINSDDFDSLLESLTSQDGSRLSLMLSDLTLMKSLPIFQTFAGNHISIQERDDNFTVDASVDLNSITSYLPLSLQTKLLAEKPQFKSLYEDLNVQVLNEATILQKFVLREFPNMPISQKESVIKSILDKWEILRLSDDLISTLKETEFVKRKQRGDIGEIVFVKPSQLLDPRHPLLGKIFDNDTSQFPVEEFASSKALEVLQQVGLGTKVDRDVFLKCAWIVEEEKSVEKGILLFEYFAENFGEFYDNNQDFTNSLCEICCVPGELNGQMDLYRFADTAAPKDKFLVFKVTPVIPEACTPPQVMFSSLGIMSPPAISTVLRQIRALTEVEGSLDRWTYKHASVETVFSAVFSFFQDNFADLSPRVKSALSDRAIVPVGSSFVKANRLFFRLSQDLAPFFYEVPRAFGAYDVLLRQLGVRETPKSSDYAVSLTELNNEMGSTRLNANELNSVIEVVNLAATYKQQSSESSPEIFAPNQSGRLVSISKMMQSDQPWLIKSGRINMNYVHLSHAKMSSEICDNLSIKRMSEKVVEVLDDQFPLVETQESSMRYAGVRNMLSSNYFQDVLQSLLPQSTANSLTSLRVLQLVSVKEIKTRFFIIDENGNPFFDISNGQSSQGPFCFITDNRVLVAKLPVGVSCELAVATAICDRYKIGRHHVGGLSALLGSQASQLSEIRNMMGLYSENEDELFRGRPGYPLVETDLDLIEIKPLKMFKKNEIVAVRMSNESSNLIYGTVSETQDASSMSRLKVCVGENKEQVFLSSQVYSFKRGSRVDDDVSAPVDVPSINVASGVLRPLQENDSMLENELNGYKDDMTTVNKDEVLFAVEDLLKSADLSLNDDVKQMMASNLALKEDMNRKRIKVQTLQNETSEVLEGIDSFLCPITREIMEDPVIASDGHTYEREAIEMWFRTSSRSPKTNESISTNLVSNYALKSAIEAMSNLRDALKSFSNQD